MVKYTDMPAPLLFNPVKHHLGYIRHLAEMKNESSPEGKIEICRLLKHIGGSVTDVYSGRLDCEKIYAETLEILAFGNNLKKENFVRWAGTKPENFKTIRLSDDSLWVIKYYHHEFHWAHIFPARMSPHSFRIKANTLKSAILYQVFIGRDFISEEGLNSARAKGGLSPIKDIYDAEAITSMIEMLRS